MNKEQVKGDEQHFLQSFTCRHRFIQFECFVRVKPSLDPINLLSVGPIESKEIFSHVGYCSRPTL